MYFDDLQQEFLAQSLDPGYRMENKQRINLSAQATAVILRDSQILPLDLDPTKIGLLSSTVLNHLFHCCAESSDASVEQCALRDWDQMQNILKALPDSESKKQLIETLIQHRRIQRQQKAKTLLKLKGESVTFRVDKKNLDYLASPDCQREQELYKNQVGLYMKAVLEEYAQLPFAQREQIYCREVCDLFRLAKTEKILLKIQLQSRSPQTGQRNILYMKPYDIRHDADQLYNYLIGYISDSKSGPWYPSSLRLTSVYSCHIRSGSGFLSAAQIKELNTLIEQFGVQYLANGHTDTLIRIRLTAAGQKMYQRILHLRPAYLRREEEDSSVYVFSCSAFQAFHYFFKFGKEAQILEPQSLQDKFRQGYQDALDSYRL